MIEGQRTKLTRVAHGIIYDEKDDLIVATEPLAASIVFLRGDANGDPAPVRVIQGPHTLIHNPWQPAIDYQHNELYIADLGADQVLVFPLGGKGDVAPLRVLRGGPISGMRLPSGVAVDSQRNVVVVAARNSHFQGALYVYDRTAQGDVKPKAIISGPTTGLLSLWHVAAYQGQIYAAAGNWYYEPPYDAGGFEPKPGCTGPPLAWQGPLGFIGVWNETDDGDVAPHAIIRGAETDLLHPSGVALDPAHGELFTTDSVRNGAFAYLVPDFFKASRN